LLAKNFSIFHGGEGGWAFCCWMDPGRSSCHR
jgi:hypothetical protein